MSELLVFLFLLLAVMAGFLLGRLLPLRRQRGGRGSDAAWLRQSYFEGLNHLLNEQPDAAIDTFVAALEVNSETLETHFALGSLLRRRGEVERAIRVHQNLLARPSLTRQQQQQAQVELGLDYMRSGLLDRAEALFKELTDSDDLGIRGTCLERLVEIYRDEKEWQAAVAMAEQLCQRKMGRDVAHWRALQAHFSCELAEQALAEQDWVQAQQWARSALRQDSESVRAQLILARIEMQGGRYEKAVRVLGNLASESPFYTSEALPLLDACYRQLGQTDVLQKLLQDAYREKPNELLLQRLATVLFDRQGDAVARAFLARELGQFPDFVPVAELLQILEEQACQVEYQRLAPVLAAALSQKGAYECRHCGFVGQQLHWCCPTCKTWGSMVSRFAGAV